MSLLDVKRVYVVQDRESGSFVDLDMEFVISLRHAARSPSIELAHECMNGALYEGRIECPSGYELHELLELCDEYDR